MAVSWQNRWLEMIVIMYDQQSEERRFCQLKVRYCMDVLMGHTCFRPFVPANVLLSKGIQAAEVETPRLVFEVFCVFIIANFPHALFQMVNPTKIFREKHTKPPGAQPGAAFEFSKVHN